MNLEAVSALIAKKPQLKGATAKLESMEAGAYVVHQSWGFGQIQDYDVETERLVIDFKDKPGAIDIMAADPPDVFNHNLETVPRLYPTIRPGSRYFTSLDLLRRIKEKVPSVFTKSGLMVGLGETREEVGQVMDDLRAADVDFLTIGQYLQPTPKHARTDKFVTPEEFEGYAKMARGKGFLLVSATPLTRSSYHAGDDFAKLRAAREAKLAAAD